MGRMDPEEILQLVADGELDPEDIEDFKELDEHIQERVADGELTMEEAREITG